MNDGITYRQAGVNIDAMNDALYRIREMVRTTYTPEVLTEIGSFGGMYALSGVDYSDAVLVSSVDGVGTKIRIASAMNRYNTIGRDLVAHCVNDILVHGARPLFFLDYFATSSLQPAQLQEVVTGMVETCREVNCALIGGETAEMPGIYHEGDYDLVGCIVGIVERSHIIDGSAISAGDAVIGLTSSGLHTNGYTLARHILFDTAGLTVQDTPTPLGGQTIGEALIEPHRSYAPSVLPVLKSKRVKGMAHITGGGFYDNIPRILPSDCSVTVDRRLWHIPPIFDLIQQLGSISDPEMYRTFNMGIGYVIIANRDDAREIIAQLTLAGETAIQIGEVYRGVHEVNVL